MQIDYQDIATTAQHDDSGIRASLERMIAAWDAGDARTFADEFTEDASYVIYVGLVYQGREEIERGHVPVFEKWQKGTRMSMLVRSIRLLDASTVAVPAVPAGAVAVIWVALAAMTFVAGLAPKETVAPATKLVPVIVTLVPLPRGPADGLTELTLGAAR